MVPSHDMDVCVKSLWGMGVLPTSNIIFQGTFGPPMRTVRHVSPSKCSVCLSVSLSLSLGLGAIIVEIGPILAPS